MMIFRLLLCLAGFATYLIVKHLLTTTPSPTPQDVSSTLIAIPSAPQPASNEKPSAIVAEPQVAVAGKPGSDARLKANARPRDHSQF